MIIKIIEAPSVKGGKALALCDDDGSMLGLQRSCSVACEVGELSICRVEFLVDGRALRFDGGECK